MNAIGNSKYSSKLRHSCKFIFVFQSEIFELFTPPPKCPAIYVPNLNYIYEGGPIVPVCPGAPESLVRPCTYIFFPHLLHFMAVAKLENMLLMHCMTNAVLQYHFYLKSPSTNCSAKRNPLRNNKVYSKTPFNFVLTDDFS